MRAKFGSDPTAGSKNLSFKFISITNTIEFLFRAQCFMMNGVKCVTQIYNATPRVCFRLSIQLGVRGSCVVVRGRARSCVRGRPCVVVRGSAWSCAVGRAWSCAVGRVRSCVVVRSFRSARFAASTAVLPASRPALP